MVTPVRPSQHPAGQASNSSIAADSTGVGERCHGRCAGVHCGNAKAVPENFPADECDFNRAGLHIHKPAARSFIWSEPGEGAEVDPSKRSHRLLEEHHMLIRLFNQGPVESQAAITVSSRAVPRSRSLLRNIYGNQLDSARQVTWPTGS